MVRFGDTRLSRDNVSAFHKLFYRVLGVSADHKLRFLYMRKLLADIDLRGFNNILDAGCGSGDYSFYFAKQLPDSQITAIDIWEERVQQNQATLEKIGLTNLTFETGDLSQIEFKNEFDFICSTDVLEHIRSQRETIERLYRALKPGGYLFIHMPLAKARPVIFDKYLRDFHEWAEDEHVADEHTRESFLELLAEIGFTVVQAENTFNHYLGEFAVSCIFLFHKKTLRNQLARVMVAPICNVLTRLDLLMQNKTGNAIAVLLRKE